MVIFTTTASLRCFAPPPPSSQPGTGAVRRPGQAHRARGLPKRSLHRHIPFGLRVCEMILPSGKYSIELSIKQITWLAWVYVQIPARDWLDREY